MGVQPHELHVEVSAGATWKPLPEAIPYEATIPLTYTTDWFKESHGTSPWSNGKCLKKEDGYGCEESILLEQLGAALDLEITHLYESVDPTNLRQDEARKRRAISLDFIASGLNYCCGVATDAQINTMVADSNTIKHHLNKLNDGLDATIRVISEESEKMSAYEQRTSNAIQLTEAKIKELQNYSKNLTSSMETNNLHQQILTATVLNSNLELSRKTIRLTRIVKMQGITYSCNQFKIPSGVIHPDVLKADLVNLQNELSKSDLSLAIPVTSLSRYYQLPVSECTFSDKSISVRIKVPVKQKNYEWKLFELITTPFAWNDQTCMIEHSSLYMATSKSDDGLISTQVTGTALHLCKPYENKLCYLPRFSGDILQGPACSKKLFHGTTVEDLSFHCPLRCHKSKLTSITEVDDETYLITHPGSNTFIQCEANSIPLPQNVSSSPGAVKITVPCNCVLQTPEDVLIPKRYPCTEKQRKKLAITHMLPAAWTNLKSYVLKPTSDHSPPKFKNIQECLNTNWSTTVPHLNLTSPQNLLQEISKKLQNNYLPEASASSWNDWNAHNNKLIMVWNILISAAIIYLWMNTRKALVPVVVNSANAQENTTPEKIADVIIFALGATVFACFAIYITIKLWRRYCKKNHLPEEVTIEDAAPISQKYTLKIPKFNKNLEKQTISCILLKNCQRSTEQQLQGKEEASTSIDTNDSRYEEEETTE
jgi:Baculovirus F protein